MKRADSLVFSLVRDLGIENSIRLIEIKKNWHNLFNEPLSSHVAPYKLSEGEILLNVDSPVWLQELNYFKKDVIEKLSPYGVREVRLRLGRVSRIIKSGVQSQKSRIEPLTTEEISYIEKTVSQIGDKELRETVRRIVEKAIILNKTKVRS